MSKPITGHMAFCIAAKRIQCSTMPKKCLLLYYAIRADENGHFFDSNFNISAETGVSDSTITRSNQAWSKLGLLTVTKPAKDSSNANDYQLHLKAWQDYAAKFNLEDESLKAKILRRNADKERQRAWREKRWLEGKNQEPTPLIQRLKTAIDR
jgi:hypothetical protein